MNISLIKFLSFLIGLFIILVIISYYKINEPFTNIDKSNLISFTPPTSNITNINDIPKNNNNDDNDNDDIIPFKGYKFIAINTYKDINKISLTDGKWYDIDTEIKNYEYNSNQYFTFNKTLKLEKNTLNNKTGALGANISSVELNGPDCFNFANNDKTYELIEFSMFMTIKLISCTTINNNKIFEMTGNTVVIDNITNNANDIKPIYISSVININLLLNTKGNYDIQIMIGNVLYDNIANDIDRIIIEDSNYLIIGLLYNKENIQLIINNKIYSDKNKNPYNITLGSKPLIINKNGNINMYLYNFVYYKNLYDYSLFDYMIRYNNYYISGLYNKRCPTIKDDTDTSIIKDNDIKRNKILLAPFEYKFLDNDETTKPSIFKRIFGLE